MAAAPSPLAPAGALELPPIGPADLVDQAEKYRLLVELAAGEPGRTAARRDAMRRIAARHPGALREWEALAPAELLRRRAVVDELVRSLGSGDAAERLRRPDLDWLRLTIAVQARLRAGLAAVPSGAGPGRGTSARGGRLSLRVHEEIARREGISVDALKAALFPSPPDQEPERGNAT